MLSINQLIFFIWPYQLIQLPESCDQAVIQTFSYPDGFSDINIIYKFGV